MKVLKFLGQRKKEFLILFLPTIWGWVLRFRWADLRSAAESCSFCFYHFKMLGSFTLFRLLSVWKLYLGYRNFFLFLTLFSSWCWSPNMMRILNFHNFQTIGMPHKTPLTQSNFFFADFMKDSPARHSFGHLLAPKELFYFPNVEVQKY